jgi:hypothetical protein
LRAGCAGAAQRRMLFDARTGRGAERQRLRDRTTEHLCGSRHTTVVRVRGCNDGTSAYAIRWQVFSAVSRSGRDGMRTSSASPQRRA